MLNISKLIKNNINKNILKNNSILSLNKKHFPATTKEWFNSNYTFFKSSQKDLPLFDLAVFKIITNYFNMFSSKLDNFLLKRKSILKRKSLLNKILVSKPEFKHSNDKIIITLYIYNRELFILKQNLYKIKNKLLAEYFFKILSTKRLTASKLTMVKGVTKRTSDVKNRILNFIKIKNTYFELIQKIESYLSKYNLIIFKYKEFKQNKFHYLRKGEFGKYLYINRKYIKLLNIYKFKYIKQLKNLIYKEEIYNKLRAGLVNNHSELSYLKKISDLFKRKRILRVGKTLNNYERNLDNINKINKSSTIIKYLKTFLLNKLNTKDIKYMEFVNKNLKYLPKFNINKLNIYKETNSIIKDLRYYMKINRVIKFKMFKFNAFILPLKIFLEKIYNKEIEFNLVNLKSYHLNSSILTQIIASKLSNRKNRLMVVIKRVLSKVKLPITRRLEYFNKVSKNRVYENIILRQYLSKHYLSTRPTINLNTLNSRIKDKKTDIKINQVINILSNDKLDSVIKSIYPMQYTITDNKLNNYINKELELNNLSLNFRKLENVVLDSIKNKTISGIRIEASGRLTKRIVAARSVFKIKQKGTIRNIDSSYKELPSILLRGNLRSNSQFSNANSKTSIGSFGLKGWVSSI